MASEPPCSESAVPHIGSANANTTNHIEQEHVASSTIGSVNLSVVKLKEQCFAEGDDDEEIVFKPPLSEKLLGVPLEKTSRDFLQPVQISDASWSYNGASVTFQSNAPVPTSTTYVQSLPVSSIGWAAEHQVKPSIGTRSIAEFFQPLKTMSGHAWVSTAAPVLGPQDTVHVPSFSNIISDQRMPASTLPGFSNTDNIPILPGQDSFLLNALKNVNISPNGFLDQRMNGLQLMGSMPQICAEATSNGTKPIIFQCKSAEVTIPSALDSVVPSVVSSAGTSMKSMETPTGVSKGTPVSRPGRHVGPPPGFKNAPLKRQDDSISAGNAQHVQVKDDVWLDGYRPLPDHVNNQRFAHSNVTTVRSAFTTPFPFPGKQDFSMHPRGSDGKQWQDFHLFGPTKQLPELNFQQESQQNGQLVEPRPGQLVWSGRYLV